MIGHSLFVACVVAFIAQAAVGDDTCNLPDALVQEIAGYAPIVDQIFDYVLNGAFKHRTWNTLADFVDKFGSRIAGSQNLENAIDYMIEKQTAAGLDNVHKEPVQVPHWVRGAESAQLVEPRHEELTMMGLGGSVGTPPEGITAEVLVVQNFDELEARSSEVSGKIVVFNEPWEGYGNTVSYRFGGASKVASHGGVACLIASVTGFSINSPHTGSGGHASIPNVALAREDTNMLSRMAARGENIVIHLQMEAKDLGMATSHNTVGELTGSTLSKENVLVSGHLDSWDVGQGAMDDGAGAFLAWNTLVCLKELGLTPKRTLTSVLWTAEEQGLYGVEQYFNDHEHELDMMDLAVESDEGTFNPRGLQFAGNEDANCVIREVLKLMTPINATEFESHKSVSSDIGYFISAGVPGMELITDNSNYFWFHHSDGDTMSVEDPDELNRCQALWAAAIYVIADLDDMLPRDPVITPSLVH